MWLITRAKHVVEAQYTSIIMSALERTLGPQGWLVIQRSFIAGARSLYEQDLHDNLTYFKVPQTGIEFIRSKLTFKIFDEYANILKVCTVWDLMGVPARRAPMIRGTPSQADPDPPLSPLSKLGDLTRLGVQRRRKRGRCIVSTYIHYIHVEEGDQQVVPTPISHLHRNRPHVFTR
jgi:hypothetical protein